VEEEEEAREINEREELRTLCKESSAWWEALSQTHLCFQVSRSASMKEGRDTEDL
jgi:hypothetical protein